MDLQQAITASIETLLNRYLSLDPDVYGQMQALQGKIISIRVQGFATQIFIFPSYDGVMVLHEFDGEADCCISGSPAALTRMALAADPRDVLFSGEVEVTGDTRLANQFNRIIMGMDVDWEDILSRATGDIAAHKLANGVRGMFDWLTRSSKSVCLDGGEYLQEESRLTPGNAELRKFIQGVDSARETADRIAARIQHLKNQKAKNNP